VAKRMHVPSPQAPMAEHGLSLLISVWGSNEKHTILLDAGISGTCLMHNAALLKKSAIFKQGIVSHCLEDAESIVLSHGHYDHFSGLPAFLASRNHPIPLVVHPAAFVSRRRNTGPGQYRQMPRMDPDMLSQNGAVLDMRTTASTVAADFVLVSGQVTRQTAFETGSPDFEACIDDRWAIDSFEDDQGLAINLKEKGLVVIGGCSHAGIINIIHHIRRVTDVDDVHAVLGGFHLGQADPARIADTIEAMQMLNPDLVVPMHCSGWPVIKALADAMPDKFVLNSVGTTYIL
jgi:7,8-dihydropterin-6-yl-methyl-4-(beta-D-ribofuranosyl)aminobenzene 5'-phosphate synthase